MKKKLIGLVFAATMLLGASMTVCATEVSQNDSVTYTGTVQVPEIKVTLTKGSNGVIVNPYGFVKSDKTPDGETLKVEDISFENKGATAVSVKLTGYVSGNSAIKVSTTKAVTSVTGKMVYLEAKIVDDAGKQLLVYDAAKKDAATTFAKLLVYGDATKKGTMAAADIPVLARHTKDGTTEDTPGTGQSKKIVVKFDGWAKLPTTMKWEETETIDVITAYEFLSVEKDKASYFKTNGTTP